MSRRDEGYIIDLCDEILGFKALRQYRFPFLFGTTGTRLPVDAFYPDLKLVIEFHERQHFEDVAFFDKPHRLTCTGVPRKEQRKIYDKVRRDLLPENGYELIVMSVTMFQHDRKKRLVRHQGDEQIIRSALENYLANQRGHTPGAKAQIAGGL